MKSNFTREQLNAQALLLGMWYDHRDHSFNDDKNGRIYDADTMAWETGEHWVSRPDWEQRMKQVADDKLGAADGPFKEVDHD